MNQNYVHWLRLLTAGLLLLAMGWPQVASGQNIQPADLWQARQFFKKRQPGAAAGDSAAVRPVRLEQLDSLRLYDALRVPEVAITAVLKPALSIDSTREPAAPGLVRQELSFKLNDEVILKVHDLRLALARSKRPATDLRLYIGNIALPMEPKQVDTTSSFSEALVRFQLVRNADTETTWQIFYRVPGKYEHEANFNLGFKEGQLGKPYPRPVKLLLVHSQLLWVGLAALALLLGSCGWLITRSNFIRSDNSNLIPLDENQQPLGLSPRYQLVPFSLAKSQVAFWTLLTIGSYLMITLVTTALPLIPSGLLGLLAVSVANGVFSQLINRPRPEALNAPAKQVVDNLGQSQGWWYDVLNDSAGVSLPRLQFVAFNAIAGVYMVYYVLAHWSLPDFDSGILALISISAAGFLANKNIENTAPDKTPANSAGSSTGTYGGGPGPDGDGGGGTNSGVDNGAGSNGGDGNGDGGNSGGNGGGGPAADPGAPAGEREGEAAPAPTRASPGDGEPGAAGLTPEAEVPPQGRAIGSPGPLASAGNEPFETIILPGNIRIPPLETFNPLKIYSPARPLPTGLSAFDMPAARAIPPPPTPWQDWSHRLRQFLQAPVKYNSDPTGVLFRGRPAAANGYRLEVRIVDSVRGGLRLNATVSSTAVAAPSGEVVFLLHPTYKHRVVNVPMQNGEASLRFFSAGCFTLVAMLDAGQTVLAYDLRNVPNAPSSFLSQ